ncbi:nucleotidyltransferase domain protein [Peptococcaceae bacterium CEB3]|nr:nucleotidyltransferase domain protein [Peptococcaceae bacterium CEB3]
MAEALSVDISPYVAGNRAKIEAEEQHRLNHYAEAREKAKKVALALSSAFPGVEIYLFGSLTTDLFEEESDIDIAVKGPHSGMSCVALSKRVPIADGMPEGVPSGLGKFSK